MAATMNIAQVAATPSQYHGTHDACRSRAADIHIINNTMAESISLRRMLICFFRHASRDGIRREHAGTLHS